MTIQLAASMARNDHAYYPLRFLSSAFFVKYWRMFIPMSLDGDQIRAVQDAARNCVDYSMQGENIYWNISFDEATALATWQLFERLTKTLPEDVLAQVRSLCVQLAVSKEETDSADYLLNLITRLRRDVRFRESVRYSDDDAAVLDAAYEYVADDLVDMMELRDAWLQSDDPWDKKLRSQTPDLPESIWVIFTGAYEPRTNLPLVLENLRLLLPAEQDFRAFVHRLELAFTRSLSENVVVKFPMLMKAG